MERLRRLVLPADDAETLDRKMLAVLIRAEQPDFMTLLLRLFSGMAEDGVAQLESPPRAWQEVQANELEAAFWALAQRELGYRPEGEPGLRDLLYRVLVTDFCRALDGPPPGPLKHFVLSERALAANASVLASRWRSDLGAFASYNMISAQVAEDIGLDPVLAGLSAEVLAETMTFAVVERRILKDLKDRVMAGAGAHDEAMQTLIARRRDGHWANALLAQTSEEARALAACYDAIEAGAGFLDLKARFDAGFSFASAEAGLAVYRAELYRFDQLYRHFHLAADAVEPMGWAVLHELRSRIEDIYTGWFLPQLGLAWDKVLESEPAGTLRAKKRYLLGQGIGISPKAWCGNTAVTAGTAPDGSLDFWVPKGASRFQSAPQHPFCRQGGPQGSDQADQGGRQCAGVRAGVSARHVLRIGRRGHDPERPDHGQAHSGRELCAPG